MASVISVILSHEAVLAACGVAILDALFALNSKAESNGVLHFIYLQLKSLKAPKV